MSENICKRCGHASTSKCNYVRHLKRMRTCPPLLEDISPTDILLDICVKQNIKENAVSCPHCEQKFNTKSNLGKHVLVCKKRPEVITREDFDMLAKKVRELEIAKQQQVATTTNNTNTNNGTINNNNNIVINAFGKENISHITSQFIAKCLRNRVDGVCDFLVKKHFDKNHPENHTVKKLIRKDNFMEIYDGRKWKLRYATDILEDVFHHMELSFANFVEEAYTEKGVIKKVWIDSFMKTVGEPLDWDLTTDAYEFDGAASEEKKEEMRSKIYKLACEYIYRHSKSVMHT